jgi:pyrroloquinoline quinone biosynthesis protein B
MRELRCFSPSSPHALVAAVCAGALALLLAGASAFAQQARDTAPFLIVLGIAQDGGVPHAGSKDAAWDHPELRRHVACIGIVDPASGKRWLLDATPDFPWQLHELAGIAPPAPRPGVDGIFLSHAHIGHYTGLMHLGLEVMDTKDVPVYAFPRLGDYLSKNGPWDRLVNGRNIALHTLVPGARVQLTPALAVEPFLVPHRQEYSEVAGFRIIGPHRSAVFIPDIDSWAQLDSAGTSIEALIRGADAAYLDGTFYSDNELPAAITARVPHPRIFHSMERFAALPDAERAKVHFIHLNHSNPALYDGPQRDEVGRRGFRLAEEGERFGL